MKDLIKLYSFYSVHGSKDEKEICKYICTRLDEMGVPYKRTFNNLYSFTKGNKVLLSAHLDQVATNGKAEHFYLNGGMITAYNDKWLQTSLGADDKNGIWIILKLLESGYKFDFIVSEGEEVGCVGIEKLEKYLPNSTAKIALVLDRKGNTDILKGGSACNYCDALATNLKNFFNKKYEVTTGTTSDTQVISQYIESVNMSTAYFNPHTASEYTDYEALKDILTDVTKVVDGTFVHYSAKPSTYQYKYTSRTSKGYFNGYSKDYY